MIGASMETYLLEKVRLVHQSAGERNFHVFYEMLAAATPQERTMFHLENYTARDFKMTSASNCYDRRDGANEIAEGMNGLTYHSKENKRNLDTLAMALAKLR